MHPICRALFFILPLVFAAAPSAAADLPDGLYARFDTDKGEIVAELYYKDTPLTVANFVGLAEGKLDSDVRRGQPFYDGLIFHRVVPGFVIQGGDPEGSGYGGPGYRFADEFAPDLKHDGPGMLSMANAGPNSNGSQFFITHAPTPHLDGKHSVFGKVISGMETVNAIARGDAIRSLTILRVGADAQTFQVTQKMFQDLQAAKAGIVSEADAPATEAEWAERIARYTQDAVTAPSGLKYVVLTQGSGDKPRKGQQVQAQYTGRFLDGAVFDSSVGRAPFAFSAGSGQVIRGWDEAILDMRVGEKRALIVPPGLAYGSRGAGGVIPPNATLFFEVERLR